MTIGHAGERAELTKFSHERISAQHSLQRTRHTAAALLNRGL
jgi:hypothetical protein